jgi:hypothetical protein
MVATSAPRPPRPFGRSDSVKKLYQRRPAVYHQPRITNISHQAQGDPHEPRPKTPEATSVQAGHGSATKTQGRSDCRRLRKSRTGLAQARRRFAPRQRGREMRDFGFQCRIAFGRGPVDDTGGKRQPARWTLKNIHIHSATQRSKRRADRSTCGDPRQIRGWREDGDEPCRIGRQSLRESRAVNVVVRCSASSPSSRQPSRKMLERCVAHAVPPGVRVPSAFIGR